MKTAAILYLEKCLDKYANSPTTKNFNDPHVVYAFQQLKIEYNAAGIPKNNYCVNFLSINTALDLAELMGMDDLVNRKLYSTNIAEKVFKRLDQNNAEEANEVSEKANQVLGEVTQNNDYCCIIS